MAVVSCYLLGKVIPAKIIGSGKLPVFDRRHLQLLNKILNLQSSKYERFVFVSDFNVGMENEAIKDFYNLYGLTSLNNEQTFYKNPANPSCIDLGLINYPK